MKGEHPLPVEMSSEQLLVEELMSRTHVVLGRLAALRGQLSELDDDLTEIECGTSELLHRLARVQLELRMRARGEP